MTILKRTLLIVIGAVLTYHGIHICIIANWDIGVLMSIAIGLTFLVYGILYKKLSKTTSRGILRIIKYTVTALICADAALAGFLAIYGVNDNVSYTEDAVIVLGAAVHDGQVTLPLQQRLDTAVSYHEKNPDAIIIVTGGKGSQESVSEASAMEKYLIENGVAPDKIIKEEQATSTNENMKFSKAILDEYFEGDYKAVIITNHFHIYRGVSIAKREGINNVSHYHAELMWFNVIPCYLRETLAVLKMWVLG